TTFNAVAAVRSIQTEHEPLARSASAVIEKLVDYDRSVTEQLQATKPSNPDSLATAAASLEAAVAAYFGRNTRSSSSPADLALRSRISQHIDLGRELTHNASERARWIEQRRAALQRVHKRIASAGGTGLAINGNQVVALRSLSELALAINA